MPVEIRELVIQAKVEENIALGKSNSDTAVTPITPLLQKDSESITKEDFAAYKKNFKEQFYREIKIWMKEYMEQTQRKF